MSGLQVEIKDWNNAYVYVTVIEKGTHWHTTWSKEFDGNGGMVSPTESQVKKAFLENRRDFEPYSPLS